MISSVGGREGRGGQMGLGSLGYLYECRGCAERTDRRCHKGLQGYWRHSSLTLSHHNLTSRVPPLEGWHIVLCLIGCDGGAVLGSGHRADRPELLLVNSIGLTSFQSLNN
jgi:hypothetical protein